MNVLEGAVLYIDKPLNWTSFLLVKRLRGKLLNQVGLKKLKVGHAGTLDPLATGVMILCTGKATKQIESFQYQTKEYIAMLKVGETTPSFDLETPVDATYPTQHITPTRVQEVLPAFVGAIQQIPPDYSACKIEGKRAYEMARKGQEVVLRPKELVIDEIELLSCELPYIEIRIVCSKGTYIRALARDIGIALESGAHLVALKRTRVGEVTLDMCHHVDELDEIAATAVI